MKAIITICLMVVYHICIAQNPLGVLFNNDINHDLFNNNLGPDDSPELSRLVIGGIRLDSTAERVITFTPFFNDELIDSFWSDFRHYQPTGHYSTIPIFDTIRGRYLHLLRLMCTDNFELSDVQKVILHHSTDGSQALLVC